MVLGVEVGLSPGDFVFDGNPSPPKKGGGAPPQFLAHFYCSERAARIKMPLGMEVGLSPGDFVLDGDPSLPPQKGGRSSAKNRPVFFVAKRLNGSRWHLAWR